MDNGQHDTSNFNSFRYTLVLTNSCRVMLLRHENELCTGCLIVSAEITIYDLFYDLLYADSWKEYLSDTWRPWVFSAIQNIYYFEERTAFWLSKKERYMLYQQYHHSAGVTMRHEADRVAEGLIEPILKKYERKYGSDFELPTYGTYDEMLKAVETAQIRVPIKEFYSFPTGDDLATWVFERIVDTEKDIQKCKWCGRYFVPARSDAQFCSPECHQKQIATGKFCGVPEIKKLYGSIMTALNRKRNSKQKYIYIGNPSDYSDGYDDQKMLSAAAPDSKEGASQVFEKKNFSNAHAAFLAENELRYGHFRDVHQRMQQFLISAVDYEAEKESYITWLKNVRKQLTLFERY